jgi:hypothetical protein
LCTLDDLLEKVEKVAAGKVRKKSEIPLWDGMTSSRVVESIKEINLRNLC